jgi:pimeloyl-ACP methyl ester carboxylesterase
MLSYHTFGKGKNILLAFHGIGQDGKSCYLPFLSFADTHNYTIYAFDLPFHGRATHYLTGWTEDTILTKSLWQTMLSDFLTTRQITRFSVCGFSLGGRFALLTLETFPHCIDNLWLIAPDGISQHPLYILATRWSATRWLFKWLISSSFLIQKIGGGLGKISIINKSNIRFATLMLNTSAKQQLIYRSWTAFRSLTFSINNLAKLLHQYKINTLIFVGKSDALLSPKAVLPLASQLPKNNLVILDSGHTRLVEKVVVYLQESV